MYPCPVRFRSLSISLIPDLPYCSFSYEIIKGKLKVNVDLYSASSWTHLRRSGMARVHKGSHSFTCTPRIRPLTEWTVPQNLCLCLYSRSWSSFTDPGRMEGWVGLNYLTLITWTLSINVDNILMANCIVFSGLIVLVGLVKKFAECDNIFCKISVSTR